MGLMYADIDRQGKHKIAIRIGWHGRPDLNRTGGTLNHEGDLEPALRQQRIVFVEHGTLLDTDNPSEKKRIYARYKQGVLDSINRLVLAREAGIAESTPLHKWVQDEKPDIVFPDACIRKKMDDQFKQQGSANSRRVWSIQGAIAALTALTTGRIWKNQSAERKKEEQGVKSTGMTRRAFLKKGATAVGLGAIGIAGINEMHYVPPIWGAILSAPGELGPFREWVRKLGGPRQEEMDMVRLRNAIMAEKIARFMQRQFKDKPAEAGLMIGVGHAMIKEYLEDPKLRKKTIESYPNLHELIDEELSASVKRCRFDPKQGQYEMEDAPLGFR